MLRARLDCLGVFLVARDDERLFAAGKSGRDFFLGPLPFYSAARGHFRWEREPGPGSKSA